MKYLNNHFITKIERISDGIQTVMNYNHAAINDFDTKIIYINNKNKPLWVEIIHSANISNRLHPDTVPVFNSKTLSPFGFVANISLSQTIIALFNNSKRFIIMRIVYLLKKLHLFYFCRRTYRFLKKT